MPETVSFAQQHGLLAMVANSGPVVLSVLILLILLSVWSWAITIAKYLQYRRAWDESAEFSNIFWETRNFDRVSDSSERLKTSPLARVFGAGKRELEALLKTAHSASPNFRTVERALKRAEFEEAIRLEKGLTFLATVASAAPFIGLFGTVWGIMNAFHGLGTTKSTTLQAVAPGISEALVATAIGLAAAIPAAVAYNYFAVALKNFRGSMDKFSSEFVSIARSHLAAGE